MQNKPDSYGCIFYFKEIYTHEVYIYLHFLTKYFMFETKIIQKIIIYLLFKIPCQRWYLFILSLHKRILPNELL